MDNSANKKNPTENTITQLNRYCRSGNLTRARQLFGRFDILPADIGEERILENSCTAGHLDVVQWLVNTFELTFEDGDMNWSCLLEAYRNGHDNVVEYLIETFGLTREFAQKDEWKVLNMCRQSDYKPLKTDDEKNETKDTPVEVERVDCLTWVCDTFLPEVGAPLTVKDYSRLDYLFSDFSNTIMVEQFLFRYGFNLEFIQKHDLSSVFKKYYEDKQGITPQGGNSIAIGHCAGATSQSCNAIAIGYQAGLSKKK